MFDTVDGRTPCTRDVENPCKYWDKLSINCCGAGTHPSTVFVVKTVLRKRLVSSHSFVLRTLVTMFEVSGLCLVMSNGFAMDDCFHFYKQISTPPEISGWIPKMMV